MARTSPCTLAMHQIVCAVLLMERVFVAVCNQVFCWGQNGNVCWEASVNATIENEKEANEEERYSC